MVSSDKRSAAEQHALRRYVCASADEPCCGVVSRPARQIEQLTTDAFLRHLGAWTTKRR
jgi:hypothetical protein